MTATRTLEEYLTLRHPFEHCDVLLVLGSFDLRVAEEGARLLTLAIAPIAVVSGAHGLYTRTQEQSEAEVFFEKMVAAGVDPRRIYLETRAMNTLENITNSWRLVEDLGIAHATWGVVARELQSRRAWLTFVQQKPLARVLSFPAPNTLRHDVYGGDVAYRLRLRDELARIGDYGRAGYLKSEAIPSGVAAAADQIMHETN